MICSSATKRYARIARITLAACAIAWAACGSTADGELVATDADGCGLDGDAVGELELPLQPLNAIARANTDTARGATAGRAPGRRTDGMLLVVVVSRRRQTLVSVVAAAVTAVLRARACVGGGAGVVLVDLVRVVRVVLVLTLVLAGLFLVVVVLALVLAVFFGVVSVVGVVGLVLGLHLVDVVDIVDLVLVLHLVDVVDLALVVDRGTQPQAGAGNGEAHDAGRVMGDSRRPGERRMGGSRARRRRGDRRDAAGGEETHRQGE